MKQKHQCFVYMVFQEKEREKTVKKMQESDGSAKRLRRMPKGISITQKYGNIKTPLREKRKGAICMELILFSI